MAQPDVLGRAVAAQQAVAQKEHDQHIIVPPLDVDDLTAMEDRPLLAREYAGRILEPGCRAVERTSTRRKSPPRPDGVQLVERLDAIADMAHRIGDDPAGGEVRDEGALHTGRD
jgi:hypothetical protein